MWQQFTGEDSERTKRPHYRTSSSMYRVSDQNQTEINPDTIHRGKQKINPPSGRRFFSRGKREKRSALIETVNSKKSRTGVFIPFRDNTSRHLRRRDRRTPLCALRSRLFSQNLLNCFTAELHDGSPAFLPANQCCDKVLKQWHSFHSKTSFKFPLRRLIAESTGREGRRLSLWG